MMKLTGGCRQPLLDPWDFPGTKRAFRRTVLIDCGCPGTCDADTVSITHQHVSGLEPTQDLYQLGVLALGLCAPDDRDQ
jgi:hypothetical protein